MVTKSNDSPSTPSIDHHSLSANSKISNKIRLIKLRLKTVLISVKITFTLPIALIPTINEFVNDLTAEIITVVVK